MGHCKTFGLFIISVRSRNQSSPLQQPHKGLLVGWVVEFQIFFYFEQAENIMDNLWQLELEYFAEAVELDLDTQVSDMV
jgi:hypothetical protein